MRISIPTNNLSSYLNDYYVSNSKLELDQSIQAEKISSLELSTSNIVRRYNLYAKTIKEFEFEPLYSNDSYTRIIINMTPDHSNLCKINNNIQYIKFDVCNLIICSSEKSITFSINAFQEALFYEIIIDDNWMIREAKKQFPCKNVDESSIHLKDLVLWEKTNSSIWKKVNGILHDIEMSVYRNINQNDLLCELLAQNIYRKIIQENSPVFPGSEVHIEKLMKVKQVLLNHLDMSLPNLSQIATQVTLSESTLKRHFKNVFGKSVYDYYLERKMEYAKQILIDEPLTINEIAERLGYEKVSNFIEIFKKRYGVSPGNIKKKNTSKKVDIQ